MAAADDATIRAWYKDKMKDLTIAELTIKRLLSILDTINHEAEKRGLDLNG